MSVAGALQVLSWGCAFSWVTVQLLIQRGRLFEGGLAHLIAGCAAAASVIAVGASEAIWPVAVLGLLWLWIEMSGHRRLAPKGRIETSIPVQTRARMPELLVSALARGSKQSGSGSGSKQSPSMVLPAPKAHPHIPHPHLPHPGKRTVDRVFKIEIGIVVIIAVVLFGIWAEQQRATFRENTNKVLCNWVEGC
jgi:hypothetical protein